jgi:subtilisin family serine protease
VIASWLAASTTLAGEGEPPVPPGRDPGGVTVALIDSGVNYTLPHIAPRLARDARGKLLGHDFDDGDNEPFDVVPGREGAAFALHHGTSVASILLREAPNVRLVPYRFNPRDFGSFAHIVEHIAKGPARIATMALGGSRQEDWRPFAEAAAAHPEILFIVSAGNDGRDIDHEPVYPASFDLQNMIVVTSSDDFGRTPDESNWGVKSVDISTPGEQITTRDHRGATRQASGSSYAVPRIAALAARLKEANPDWGTQALKSAVLAFAVSPPRAKAPRTRHGWIVNPALAGPKGH